MPFISDRQRDYLKREAPAVYRRFLRDERAMGFEDLVKEARWAAESHRVTRQWVKTTLKEGDLMTDICERIENKTRACSGLTPPPSTAA